MRSWGLLISGFYVVVLLFVLIPMIDILTPGRLLVWPALLIVGQAFISIRPVNHGNLMRLSPGCSEAVFSSC